MIECFLAQDTFKPSIANADSKASKMRCWRCGVENAEGAYCHNCGAQLNAPPPAYYPPPQPQPRNSSILLILAVVVIAVIVIGAVVAVAFFASLNHATITISVTNNEASTAEITVMSNMHHVATNSFAPGETRVYDVTESFRGSSSTVLVSATGINGSGFDSNTITIVPGGHYSVDLFV
ncbi:MAG TPA: hypothetical protein VMB46_06945 [Methanomassiliicoccales archaeon]|nr:hypothetical protein [Methanomassiliicoccales archaeon]